MSGFKLNLKSKVSKPKKTTPINHNRKSVFGNLNNDDDEDKKTDIDAFLARGAMAGNKATDEKEPLVIKIQDLKSGLLSSTERKNSGGEKAPQGSGNLEQNLSAEQKARQSLLKGDKALNDSDKIIPLPSGDTTETEASEPDYQDVPVEDFGAALLRGMGWDGKERESKSPAVTNRQKGAVLGIGAKPFMKDIDKDVMGSKNEKLSVPLKRVAQKNLTGDNDK